MTKGMIGLLILNIPPSLTRSRSSEMSYSHERETRDIGVQLTEKWRKSSTTSRKLRMNVTTIGMTLVALHGLT